MKIKICGITHPDDALSASRAGADYIGLIFAKNSRRCIDEITAMQIVETTKNNGSTPVGVFSEQQSDDIIRLSKSLGINVIQLHGNTSRKDVHTLSPHFTLIFYAIDVDLQGIYPPIPTLPENTVLLFDSEKSATKKPFDLKNFSPPNNHAFFLAGGLNSDNISQSIKQVKPAGIDIAGGVEKPNSLRKCPEKMKIFIQQAKGALK